VLGQTSRGAEFLMHQTALVEGNSLGAGGWQSRKKKGAGGVILPSTHTYQGPLAGGRFFRGKRE